MIDIDKLSDLSRRAGAAILEIYNSDDFGVEHKDDNSPLTKADKASHEIIKAALTEWYPEIKLISEEGKDVTFEERKDWDEFWLVDPLDGTKEFIKRNGEFTVNIALIRDRKPVLGVIYAPVLDTLYAGIVADKTAWKIGPDGERVAIKTNTDFAGGLTAVQSRSHSSAAETEFFGEHKVVDSLAVGSSLKFCMVAEGKAHMYYRSGPTWEWDSAAGQAILEGAGGLVLNGPAPLNYNKPTLKNDDGFLCLASEALKP